jgi:hypothetical protein
VAATKERSLLFVYTYCDLMKEGIQAPRRGEIADAASHDVSA